MKTIKWIAVCCVLVLLAFPLAVFSQQKEAAVEVEPGYDYSRLKDADITLNVYNWGEYMSLGVDGESMDVNAAFTELTGIKVNYTTFDTNENLYSKLKSGGAEYDIIIPSDYMIGRMIKEDMLAPLEYSNIPNHSFIGKPYLNREYDPDNSFSVPYLWGYVGIIYNTAMVNKPVDSWAVLWDPEYQGDILMFDNSRDAFAIAAKLLGQSMNPTTTQQIDQQAEKLSEQRGVVQAYVMDQIFDKMEGGEAAIAPYYAGDAITMMETNPDLAFAVPKEGTNYFVDAMCIPKGSVNKEAAEMYINFLCETQVAVANSVYTGYSTPQIKAQEQLPPEIRNNPIAYPSQEVLENTEIYTVLPEELNAHMDRAWAAMRSQSENGNGWIIPVALAAAIVVVVVLALVQRAKKKKGEY